MTRIHRDNHLIGRPSRGGGCSPLPRIQEWLRAEEFHDGDALVVRTELPDIDPDKDVEITISGGVIRIHAHREQKKEHKEKRSYRSEFRYRQFELLHHAPSGIEDGRCRGQIQQRHPRISDSVPGEHRACCHPSADSSNLIGTEIPHGPYWLT